MFEAIINGYYFQMNEAGGEPTFGAAPAAPAAAPAQPAAPAEQSFKFPETLAPEFRSSNTFKKFANEDGSFDYGKVMQSYAQLEKHLGGNRIPVPNETFTDDDWRGVFQKLGLPESVDKYDLKANLPEGYKPDDVLMGKFKEVAHKAGVLPKQAQQLVDFFNNYSVEALTEMEGARNAKLQTAEQELKKSWGDAYGQKVERANHALHQFATEAEVAEMRDAGLLNPTFLKVFDKIAAGLSEDTFVPSSKGTFGQTVEDMQQELNSYYAPNHPFSNRSHPQHQFYSDKAIKMLTAIASARNN